MFLKTSKSLLKISNLKILRNASTSSSHLSPKTKNLLDKLLNGDRASLAQSITLIESSLAEEKVQARQLISLVQESVKSKDTFRIGLTGPPGAGKSTFIELFGTYLTENGHKVAVLAVDPSSSRTGGSLLGDKTRMTELSRNKNAFIRPSPNRGHLGGVARTTNESILLCEACGYDIVLVETVGVGQAEHLVADMVDALCLILPPAAGDELQGIKRGIVEQCDLVMINKSDGDLMAAANRTRAEYLSALKFMQPKSKNWKTQVMKMSAKTNLGIDEVWDTLTEFKETMIRFDEFEKRRNDQQAAWMWHYIHFRLIEVRNSQNIENNAQMYLWFSWFQAFKSSRHLKEKQAEFESRVFEGSLNPGVAADLLLAEFWNHQSHK